MQVLQNKFLPMNSIKTPLLIAACFSILAVMSCNNNGTAVAPGCGSVGWGVEVEDELTALSNAGVAFGQDPSQANCEKYKDAYRAYIQALKDLDRCVINSQERQEYLQALEDAEDALDNLC